MTFIQISIIISLLIGIFIILKIRNYDIYEKEPILSMFLVFLIGGISSIVISGAVYFFIKHLGVPDTFVRSFFGSFLVIGPIEETSKLLGLIISYKIIKKQINEITDGVIYISCVALGFSLIENIFYANQGVHNEHLLVFRLFISTPAHIAFSGIIGYAYYRFLKEKKPFKVVIIGLIIAIVLHGIYDAIIFLPMLKLLLLPYFILIIGQLINIIQLTNLISPFRPNFLDTFKENSNEIETNLECPYCKSKHAKQKFLSKYFTAYKCDDCGYFIATIKDLKRIFQFHAPEYKNLRKEMYPVEISNGKYFTSIYACTYFKKKEKYGFFNPERVDSKIRTINSKIVDSFYSYKIIPTNVLAKIMD